MGEIEAIAGATAKGWACDPQAPEKTVRVRFFADHTVDRPPLGGAGKEHLLHPILQELMV